MKRYVAIIITILCLCLCSCDFIASPNTPNAPLQDNTNISVNNENSSTLDTHYPLYYNSLIDFKKAINPNVENDLYVNFVENEENDRLVYFIEKMRTQNIVAPYLDGKIIEFRNKDSYANIALFASEAYGLPWVFYYPIVSTNENFYIKITYLPDTVINQKNATASEIIKALSPNSPNINNLGKQHENIYNQKMKLSDREVTALVYEYKTDNRNSIMFIYEDLLVEIRCDPDVWNEQWFSSLSFDIFDE